MISMVANVSQRVSPDIEKLLKGLPKLKKAYVTVGFHSDSEDYPDGTSVVLVAACNEFGTSFNPWAHDQKGNPSRSFLRATVDQHMTEINQWREQVVKDVIAGASVEKAMEKLAFNVKTLVENKIKSNVPPENTPTTKEMKQKSGSNNAGRTLMDTEHMLRQLSYKVHV